MIAVLLLSTADYFHIVSITIMRALIKVDRSLSIHSIFPLRRQGRWAFINSINRNDNSTILLPDYPQRGGDDFVFVLNSYLTASPLLRYLIYYPTAPHIAPTRLFPPLLLTALVAVATSFPASFAACPATSFAATEISPMAL